MPPKPKEPPAEPTLLTVEAGKERHAVRVIYPDSRTKARCGAMAVAEAPRKSMPVSSLTCPACKAWAEGAA